MAATHLSSLTRLHSQWKSLSSAGLGQATEFVNALLDSTLMTTQWLGSCFPAAHTGFAAFMLSKGAALDRTMSQLAETCLGVCFACDNLSELVMPSLCSESGAALGRLLEQVQCNLKKDLATKRVVHVALLSMAQAVTSTAPAHPSKLAAGSWSFGAGEPAVHIAHSDCTTLLAVWALPPFASELALHHTVSACQVMFNIPPSL